MFEYALTSELMVLSSCAVLILCAAADQMLRFSAPRRGLMLDGWSKIGLAGELSHRDNWCNSSSNYPEALCDLAIRRETATNPRFLAAHLLARSYGMNFAELLTCLVYFE